MCYGRLKRDANKRRNARFLAEAVMLEKRWVKSGLLDVVRNQSSRKALAAMLENQRLMNEQPEDHRPSIYQKLDEWNAKQKKSEAAETRWFA